MAGIVWAMPRRPPPHVYFVFSAIFHYLGPAFAVLLFVRVDVLGVAWLRIASAALIFALWRKPWRVWTKRDGEARTLLVQWGVVLALMNCCFYVAIDRLPLGTVAAIEFLPVIVLAALGARTPRNAAALLLAVPASTCSRACASRASRSASRSRSPTRACSRSTSCSRTSRRAIPAITGIDGLGLSMLIAAVVVTPIAGWAVPPALTDPVAILAGIGVGVSLLGDPLRRRPARDARAAARDLRADGLAAARHRDRDRRRRARPATDRRGARRRGLVVAGVALTEPPRPGSWDPGRGGGG